MREEDYRRYVQINLPHARTITQRVGRSVEVLGGFAEARNGGAVSLHAAFEGLEGSLRDFDDDPPAEEALAAANRVADRARALVEAILATSCRGDRLGQHVRNLFECLGLAEEGAELSVKCGEWPDSPLR